jgi:hypothetical protein
VELHQVEHFLKGLALFQGCIAAAADGDSPVFGQITALKLLQEGHADLVAWERNLLRSARAQREF